ncbi:hypothetical protein [Bergeriella denitrificans]|uniref:Phage associated protein n=1 Tax=Bergeriella denitrificans TaxID=494 RepID=A0A378UTZ9_BERDE|nr:hypothetical protein [Bergeriella denitrificans]STZ75300.1 phage associated protein [Bergeriella denitrificans]STZ76100.1 phage associated protein [Bergeriella denitrificans]STZ83032.1 phage associated protein [Bergeriella denitrificans]
MSNAHLKQLRGQVDPVLTRLALGYKQADFIAERVFPVVFTDKEGVRVPVFGKGSFVEYDTERAVGAASNIITLDSPGYLPVVLEEHDLAAGVDYREQAESQYDERAKATRRAVKGVQLRQEIETARLLSGKAAYESGHSKDLSATKQWSNPEADVLSEIADAKEVVRAACGVTPRVLVVGASVLHALQKNEALRGALGANERKTLLSTEQIRNLLDLDDIIVGGAVSTPHAKKQTADVWGKFASLIVRPNAASGGNDEGEPSFGYTFRRRGMPLVDRYEAEGGKVEYARYTDIRKAAVVGSTCGFLFEKAIA